MWIAICLLSVIYPGLASASSACKLHSYNLCGVDEVPDLFPGTSKQLYFACKTLIPFMKCVIQTEEICESDPNFIRMHYDYLNVAEDMCDKESSRHSDVLNNLECVKPLFDDNEYECYESYPGNKEMKRYAQALREAGYGSHVFTKNKEDRKDCLHGLYVTYCQAAKMHEKCGNRALEAFIKIIYIRNMVLVSHCNERVKDRLIRIYWTFTEVNRKHEEELNFEEFNSEI